MNNTAAKKRIFKIVSAVISLLFWILVWAIVSYRVNNEFLLPDPLLTLKRLLELAAEKDFWISTSSSLLRILIGIGIAVLLGCIAAILSSALEFANSLFSPLMTVVKATPIASFICLAYLWIRPSTLPIFITALIVLPIVWSNVVSGIRSVDKNLLEVAKVYRFSPSKKLLRIYVPSVLPYFLAACRSSLGMAWKAGIAAEVIAPTEKAIGTEIYFAKNYFETPDLFAWTLTVIILSIIIEKLLIWGLSRLSQKLRVAEVHNDKI